VGSKHLNHIGACNVSVPDTDKRKAEQSARNTGVSVGFADGGVAKPVEFPNAQDLDENILVGVCGESGAGKTVFFCAVYRTLTQIKGLGRVTIDRHKGNPAYFEGVERVLRQEGKITGTTDVKTVRLIPRTGPGVLLFDFMGGQFSDFADPNASRLDKAQLEKVHGYLEKCDALIVLIKSTIFGKVRPGGGEGHDPDLNPWPAAARALTDICEQQNKPMALVFTQSDLNPGLDLAKVRTFYWVREFEAMLQSVKPSGGARPYGRVHLMTCYETDRFTQKPLRRPEGDNSIFLPTAARIFEEMLLAARPRALERIGQAARDAEVKRKAEERKRSRERNKWWLGLSGVAAAAILAVGAIVGARAYMQHLGELSDVATVLRIASALRERQPERLGTDDFAALDRVQKRPPEGDGVLDSFQGALVSALSHIAPSVYSGDSQQLATNNLLRLAGSSSAGDARTLELLRLHSQLVDAHCSGGDQPQTAALAPQRSDVYPDARFADAVMQEAATLRNRCAQAYVEELTQKESELPKLVDLLHTRLGADRQARQDPRWQLAKKKAYAMKLGSALAGGSAASSIGLLVQKLGFVSGSSARSGQNFRVILEGVRKLGNASGLREDLQPLLHRVAQNDEDLSTPLKYFLGDLFGAAEGELGTRQGLWEALFKGMDDTYYFASRPDAWPSQILPLKEQLRNDLAKARYSNGAVRTAIDQMAGKAVYSREVDAISALLDPESADNNCDLGNGSKIHTSSPTECQSAGGFPL
jgi:hypothetical protein